MNDFFLVPEIIEGQLILRSTAFIFAFFGMGLFLDAGSKSTFIEREAPWKKAALQVSIYACYGLALLNVLMTVTWLIMFFFLS